MCRNHRGWIDAVVACSKLGAQRAVPQHRVLRPAARPTWPSARSRRRSSTTRSSPRCWPTPATAASATSPGRSPRAETKDPTLEDLIERGDTAPTSCRPSEQGRAIILTSGTTGTPKGASRSMPKSIDPIAALLSVIPLQRAREDDDRGAAVPRLGLRAVGARHQPRLDRRAQAQVRRGGDAVADRPARVHRARRRAGDDPAHPRARRRGARPLRPLEGPRRAGLRLRAAGLALATAGWTTSATTSTTSTARPRSRGRRSPRPSDLREAPGTVGQAAARQRRARSTTTTASRSQDGETGRIFVGNDVQFEGYTGGGNKDEIDGLLSSGDVGHFDDEGRLFIDGRDDDMIVSGGENVFPAEVEDLLQGHERRSTRPRSSASTTRSSASG